MMAELIKSAFGDSCNCEASEAVVTCPFCLIENLIVLDSDGEILYVEACKHFKPQVGENIERKREKS